MKIYISSCVNLPNIGSIQKSSFMNLFQMRGTKYPQA